MRNKSRALAALRDGKLLAAIACVFAIGLVATACGSDGDSSATTNAGGTETGGSAVAGATQIKVTAPPVMEAASIYVAQEEGFFEEEGLEVEIVPAASAAAQIPALTSGDVQFAQTTPVTGLTAVAQGIPVRLVAGLATAECDAQGEPTDTSAIMAGPNTGIKTLKDLEGKTLNILVFESPGEFTAREVLEKNGVDVSTIELVEVGFPEVPQALKSGRVDASWASDPFRTIAESEGSTAISPVMTVVSDCERIDANGWITTQSYLEDNPEVVEHFQNAIYKAQEFSNENPDVIKAVTEREFRVDPKLVAQLKVPTFATDIGVASYEDFYVPMVEKYMDLPEDVNIEEFLGDAAS